MAATYTLDIKFSLSLGSRRVNLVELDITSYDSSGLTLLPQQLGMGVVEMVLGTVMGHLGGADSPVVVTYDNSTTTLNLYSAADTPIPSGVNIYSNNGPILLLVIGA